MDMIIKEYRYKGFNIFKMLNSEYCFITNNTHDINNTPTYEEVLYIKDKLDLNEDYEIIFHFDDVFGLIILKNGERFFSKKLHKPEEQAILRKIQSYFDEIPSCILGQKPIQLD